jgi:hypothetical protein
MTQEELQSEVLNEIAKNRENRKKPVLQEPVDEV